MRSASASHGNASRPSCAKPQNDAHQRYEGPLRLLAAEPERPYGRPPLSKEFLAGELDERVLRFRADDWYADNAVDMSLGDPISALDAAERAVVLESGRRVRYGNLLIA